MTRTGLLLSLLLSLALTGCKNDVLSEDADAANGFMTRLQSAPFEETDSYPEWLSLEIGEMESRYNPESILYKVRIYKGEWNRQTVYFIRDIMHSCMFCEIYYEDGEQIVFHENRDDFYIASTRWTLVYEYGEALDPLSEPVWDYPVKPGMEEWETFESNREMVDACQIPENVLLSLSTEDLTDLCLQYPLLADVFAFDNLNSGLDKLFSDFNGLRELYSRTDVSKSLMKRYARKVRDFSFLDGKASDVEKGLFIISVSILEVLSSRVEAGKAVQKEILQNLVSGYEEKCKQADYFTGIGFQSNFYARSHVLLKLDKSSVESLPQGVFHSGMADTNTTEIINRLSYKLIQ